MSETAATTDNLILRASTGGFRRYARRQVGIVDVDLAFENDTAPRVVPSRHQLVVDQPGRRVARPSCRMGASADSQSPAWRSGVDRETRNGQRAVWCYADGAGDQRI